MMSLLNLRHNFYMYESNERFKFIESSYKQQTLNLCTTDIRIRLLIHCGILAAQFPYARQ